MKTAMASADATSKTGFKGYQMGTQNVSLGVVTLGICISVGVGMSTAFQHLAHSPGVNLSKKKRLTFPELDLSSEVMASAGKKYGICKKLGQLNYNFIGQQSNAASPNPYQMSNVNRGWMSRRMKSDRITLTDEYKNGVEEFLDSAKRFGLTKDKTLCPCKNCGNSHWENLDSIKFHLYASGFFESYTVWTLHGEKEPTTESRRTRHRKRRAPPIVEPPVDMLGLLRDSSGQDFYSFNDMRGSNISSMNDAEESPNFDASQFYTDANESGAPIYPGDVAGDVAYYVAHHMD
ncbi:hypothetical protein AgCh_037510 [Apium graveolens]